MEDDEHDQSFCVRKNRKQETLTENKDKYMKNQTNTRDTVIVNVLVTVHLLFVCFYLLIFSHKWISLNLCFSIVGFSNIKRVHMVYTWLLLTNIIPRNVKEIRLDLLQQFTTIILVFKV